MDGNVNYAGYGDYSDDQMKLIIDVILDKYAPRSMDDLRVTTATDEEIANAKTALQSMIEGKGEYGKA